MCICMYVIVCMFFKDRDGNDGKNDHPLWVRARCAYTYKIYVCKCMFLRVYVCIHLCMYAAEIDMATHGHNVDLCWF